VNDIVEVGTPEGAARPTAGAPGGSQGLAAPGGSQVLAAEVLAAEVPAAEVPAEVPAAEVPAEVLAAEVLAAISGIRRVARRAARAAWQAERLPPAQSELLRLAAARPGISVAEAAHELRLAPNTVSTLVGRLDAAGLLERARAVADGRSVRLSVTDKGTRRIAEFRDLRAELAGRALDRLTADDRQALADAVPALLRLAAQLAEEHA
jgi:DNA-binding MarR family transcriptional regulator